VDRALQQAFLEASKLAPDNWQYRYRYGLSFYDVAKPDWSQAETFWKEFEATLKPGVEQQTCRLHQARALLKQGRKSEASERLASVDEPVLERQKRGVAAEIAAAEIDVERAPEMKAGEGRADASGGHADSAENIKD